MDCLQMSDVLACSRAVVPVPSPQDSSAGLLYLLEQLRRGVPLGEALQQPIPAERLPSYRLKVLLAFLRD